MAGEDKTIAIFGATGYTGRLIAHELHRHALPVLLAGRDARKLAALAAHLGGAETLVADVGDRGALDELARRTPHRRPIARHGLRCAAIPRRAAGRRRRV
jgi:short subunit dehydrogenase-like uncharacterized protein